MARTILLKDFDFLIVAREIAAVRFREGRIGERIPAREDTFLKRLWRTLRAQPHPMERYIKRQPSLDVFFRNRDQPNTFVFYAGDHPPLTDIDAWADIERETKQAHAAIVAALTDDDGTWDEGQLDLVTIAVKTKSEPDPLPAPTDASTDAPHSN